MYAHFRPTDIDGKPLAKGGATLYYEISDSTAGIEIRAGVAVCSKRDCFWYLQGREIAKGRFDTYGVAPDNIFRFNHIIKTLDRHVINRALQSIVARACTGIRTYVMTGFTGHSIDGYPRYYRVKNMKKHRDIKPS